MKIKVINIISDTNIGGAGRCLLSFIDSYDREKLDLSVFLPASSLLCPELTRRGVAYREVPHINDASMRLSAVTSFLKLFKSEKPHIVHTHAVMSARLAAKLYGKCAIVHTRHSVFDLPLWQKKFPARLLLGGINNFLSDFIIAVSPAAKENIVEIGTNPNKVKIVFNGVNRLINVSEQDKAEFKERLGIKDEFVVSIIARLEEVKGHDYLLDAAKAMLELDKEIKIVIAGAGTLSEHICNRIKNEGLSNVVFAGFVKEVDKLLAITHLQVNASYGTEATSLSLLEGMSIGVPAVVSDFGGNPYVIKKGVNGIVVPKKNAEVLMKAVLKLKNDKELYNTLSQGAISTFDEKFTSKAMAEGITKVYTEALDFKQAH